MGRPVRLAAPRDAPSVVAGPPVPSEQVPPAFPWQEPRPAGDWCRPIIQFGMTVGYQCIRG